MKKLRKNTYLLLSIILLFSLWGCKDSHEKKQDVTEDENIELIEKDSIENQIVFIGKSDEGFKHFLTFLDFSNFSGQFKNNLTKEMLGKNEDSIKIIINGVKSPQIIEMMHPGESNIFNTRMLISPGDSINFEIKNGKLSFTGKNAANYNFFYALDKNSDEWSKIGFSGNLKEYKTKAEKTYNRRKNFFDTYVKENPSVSEEFKRQVRSELKFEYLYNLISPRSIKTESTQNFVNDLDGLASSLNNTGFNNEDLINLKDYYDNVLLQDFKKPDLIQNDYYKRALKMFVRHYFVSTEYFDYSQKNFNDELSFINKNFQGETEIYLKGKLITDYYEKGFGNGEKDKETLLLEIAEYKEHSLKPSYTEVINDIEKNLKNKDTKIPATLLTEKVVNYKGDTISIANLLEKYSVENKAIIFSGPTLCEACENDLPSTKSFKRKIENEKKIKFLYIGVIDGESLINWRKRVESADNEINRNDQFKLISSKSSLLLKYLNIRVGNKIIFPKTSILNSKGKILLNNLPKISDTTAFKRAIQSI